MAPVECHLYSLELVSYEVGCFVTVVVEDVDVGVTMVIGRGITGQCVDVAIGDEGMPVGNAADSLAFLPLARVSCTVDSCGRTVIPVLHDLAEDLVAA